MMNQTASPTLTLPTAKAAARAHPWHRFALGGVLLLAVCLHFFRLEQEGYGNLYYAAAVKSMLTSWRNFFYVSFDPGGFVSVDKSPLGLWTQALSATIFGFNGWSLMLPQALAGVLSVALLYHLVRRVFGPTAGVIAALVLALTPISLAANRNNTMDSQLVFTSLLATWAVSLAADAKRGRLRWLLLCAFFVGLGFNIKMLQAVMVLPAFYLWYLITPPIAWWKRVLHLALASVVLIVVSFAWVVAVDLTPPDQRPFVGSSHDNTVMELIVGHNGLARLGILGRWFGGSGPRAGEPPPGSPPGGQPGGRPPDQPPRGQSLSGNQPPQNPPPSGGQPGRGPLQDETGEAGPFRLFNKQLAGQISWLLPLAGLGLVAAAWQIKRPDLSGLAKRPRSEAERGGDLKGLAQRQALILWGAWLAPQVVFFSYAGLFHRYYLEMLSPAIAALVGAGFVALWNDYRHHRWRGWLLPVALVVSAGVEAFILAQFPGWSRWLTPLVVGLSLVAAIGLIVSRLIRSRSHPAFRLLPTAFCFLSLLIAPTTWASTVLAGRNASLPYAGPELLERPQRSGGNRLPDVSKLVDYLSANRNGEKFLVATLNANSAAPIILATGEPVMALGGFSGSDNILATQELAAKVAQGEVRFFLVPLPPGPPPRGDNPGGGPLPNAPGQQSDTLRWVAEHCTAVPLSLWQSQSSAPPPPNGGPGGQQQLFDCGSAQ